MNSSSCAGSLPLLEGDPIDEELSLLVKDVVGVLETQQAGMDDHVPKPISAEALVTALNKAVPIGAVESEGGDGRVENENVSEEGRDTTVAVLDEEKIEELRSILGDGPEGVDGLVDTFIERTPDVLAELDEAAQAGDEEGVGHLAHKIKGEASTLGAKRLSLLAKQIEDEAREQELDDPVAAARRLEDAFEETEQAFHERRSDGQAGED